MDRKYRWCGFLEFPVLSKVQRNLIDGGRNRALFKLLSRYSFRSVIDIGCGLGETSQIFSCPYVGIDDSAARIAYATRKYPHRQFMCRDAKQLSFTENMFDASLLISTSHHLADDTFCAVLKEMIKISRHYIIVSDAVYYPGQSAVSRYLYSMDRGGCFRTAEQMVAIFKQVSGLELERKDNFTTFPGFYQHAVFVLKNTANPYKSTE